MMAPRLPDGRSFVVDMSKERVMTFTTRDALALLIPEHMIKELGAAADRGAFVATVIMSPEVMDQLNGGEFAMISTESFCLIMYHCQLASGKMQWIPGEMCTQETVEDIYKEKVNARPEGTE
jgi:hypothetical protein